MKKIIYLLGVIAIFVINFLNISVLVNDSGKAQIKLSQLQADATCEDMSDFEGVILLMEECYYSGPRGNFAGCEDGGSECSAHS